MKTVSKSSTFLFAFSGLLTFSIFLLIVAGGLVTSKEAGLAVPDWPLSYGQMFPPMVGNIFWEHGHRMIAGGVGILTLLFTITVHFLESRGWVKALSRWMLGAVVLQAVLGGVTVLLILPPPVSILHATLGQSYFCLALAMAYFQSPFFQTRALSNETFPPEVQKITRRLTEAIFIQLMLGAVVRHTEPVISVVFHIGMAMLIVFLVMLMLVRLSRETKDPGLTRLGVGLGAITTAQIFLGMGAFIFKRVIERTTYAPGLGEVFFASAHQSVGALVLGVSLLLTLRVRK